MITKRLNPTQSIASVEIIAFRGQSYILVIAAICYESRMIKKGREGLALPNG